MGRAPASGAPPGMYVGSEGDNALVSSGGIHPNPNSGWESCHDAPLTILRESDSCDAPALCTPASSLPCFLVQVLRKVVGEVFSDKPSAGRLYRVWRDGQQRADKEATRRLQFHIDLDEHQASPGVRLF